jgi:uridylate kinase
MMFTQSKKEESKLFIISLGGSLVVPDAIDTVFLSELNKTLRSHIQEGYRFVLIVGGGKICRRYQDAARSIVDLSAEDLDWLGIHSTRLNGHLLRTIFRDIAYPVLVKDPEVFPTHNKSVTIAAGSRPGWSTDYVAVRIAHNTKSTHLINLSNIDGVYTEDPKKNPLAKRFDTLSWSEFRKLLPEKWDPGLSSPFDPIAAKEAEKINLTVSIINGNNLPALSQCIKNESFLGTQIS